MIIATEWAPTVTAANSGDAARIAFRLSSVAAPANQGSMPQPKTLSEKQVELLRWIADGCPASRPGGEYYRISAAALRNRGLVTISGRGASWSAEVTAAGRDYLAKADGPSPPKPRQPNTLVTEQLVSTVTEAGGSLTLPRLMRSDPDYVDYRSRVRLAERHGKVPEGKRLRIEDLSCDEMRIELVDDPADIAQPTRPVLVPATIGTYHPVVREFKERSDRHEVSRAALPRVLRILQALVAEAERRGYTVQLAPEPQTHGGYGARDWTGPNDGHLVISARGLAVRVRVCEEGIQSRAYWTRQNRRFDPRRRTWTLPSLTEFEAKATGRLVLEFVNAYWPDGRVHRWADRKAWTLEDKLPDVLRGVEVCVADYEERQRQAAHEAAERHRAQEAAAEEARKRRAYQQRADVLAEQVSRWRACQDIRDYCRAAEAAHPADPGTADWVGWARAHADTIDPLRTAPRGPAPENPASLAELEPYPE
jgi:hypothetical protein